jgi:hypothetical protein
MKLDRRMDRTLYLVVKRENGGWGFPAGVLEGTENLHQVCSSPIPPLLHLQTLCCVCCWICDFGLRTDKNVNRQQNASSSKRPAST